jgi:glutathione S-transferase
VPAIDDDGLVLCESMAINLYLSEKYGKAPFWPSTVAEHARVYQWSFWGMMECEGHLLTAFLNRMMLPPEQRNEKAAKEAIEALGKPLKVLDDHLKGREYILGKDFTVADLNVGGVLILLPMMQVDMSSTPSAKTWLDKCLARPALERARAKG